MVMLPAKLLVLLTDKFVTPVTAPLNTPAPVIVKLFVPPVMPLVVMVVPTNVRSPPLKVTAPV